MTMAMKDYQKLTRTCQKSCQIAARRFRNFSKRSQLRMMRTLGVPYGIRTRVTNVKGWCPRPLDEGDGGAVG